MPKLTIFRLLNYDELGFTLERFYTTETTRQLLYGESSSWVSVYYPALVDLLAQNDQTKAVRVLVDLVFDRPVLYFNHILQQECIPVGCLLSAAVAVCLGVSVKGAVCPGGVCPEGCLPRGVSIGGECVCPRGVCPGTVCPEGCLPRGVCPGGSAQGVSARGVCPRGVCPEGCQAHTPL